MASDNVVVANEMRDRTTDELRSLVSGKREDLATSRFKHAMGQITKTHELRSLRRDVARLETLIRERKAD